MRMTLRNMLVYPVAIVSMAAAGGCAGCFGSGAEDSASENEVTSVGTNVTGPLSALGALANLANNTESLQAELADLAEMEPVDPVHFSVLLDALPDPLADEWTADEPRGETNQMGQFSMSVASNTFRRDDGVEIEVTISDFAFNQLAYSGFTMAAAFS